MRIDLLLDSKGFGGIEAHVFELSKALVNCGHEATVIFLNDYGPHPLKNKLQQKSIKIAHINKPFLTAIAWLRQRQPDVLHTHGYKAGIIGRLAGQISTFGVCSSYHAGEPGSGKLALYTWLDKVTAPLAQEIIAVSHKIAQTLPAKTQVLSNFVEPKLAPNQGKNIAFVGRLSDEKAADRFIHSAQQLPNTLFHIYGDGPLSEHYKKHATPNVIFHGAQPMEHHWPNIGLLIMPSRYEGLPLAALEAMGHGIPVIATPVGDLVKLIQHNKNGWLINTSAHHSAMKNINHLEKNIIDQIVNSIEYWQQLTQQQKSNIQKNALNTIAHNYSAQANLPKFLKCYSNAIMRVNHA